MEPREGADMSTRKSIGLTGYRASDITPEELIAAVGTAEPDPDTLLLIDRNLCAEFLHYIIETKGLDLRSPAVQKLRAYTTSLPIVTALDGTELVVVCGSLARLFLETVERNEQKDFEEICLTLDEFAETEIWVLGDGLLSGDGSAALAAWERSSHAVHAFVTQPRRAHFADLEDLLPSIEGQTLLLSMLESLRRMLLAAARSYTDIGAATIGHRTFPSMEAALNQYRVAKGDATRRLGDALYALASRTPGLEHIINPVENNEERTDWIAAYSRLGQDVTAWMLGRPGILEAETVGWLWPGPAIYGLEDLEQNPRAGYLLLEAIESETSPHGLLYGTYDVAVSDDGTTRLPVPLVKGEQAVYLTIDEDVFGEFLYGQGEHSHFATLGHYIADEQKRLAGCSAEPSDEVADDKLFPTPEDVFERSAFYADAPAVDNTGAISLLDVQSYGFTCGAALTATGCDDSFFLEPQSQHELRSEQVDVALDACFFKSEQRSTRS